MPVLLVALLALLLTAPTALADDASLEGAWDGYRAESKRLERQLDRTSGRDMEPIKRIVREGERLATATRDAMTADTASSETGARARRAALRSLDAVIAVTPRALKAFRRLAYSERMLEADRLKAAARAIGRALRVLERAAPVIETALRQQRRAGRLFREASEDADL